MTTPREPQVRSKNEAAEWLGRFLDTLPDEHRHYFADGKTAHERLDAALAWERRRTVERIRETRETLAALSFPLGSTREAAQHERDTALSMLDDLGRAILTESETSDE